MLDLFIALFGGAYYASKIGSDKSVHKKAAILRKSEIEQMKSDYYSWQDLVVDEGLERKFAQEMTLNPDKTFETIKAELNDIKIFELLGSYCDFVHQCSEEWEKLIPIRMLMAKKGKLSKKDSWIAILSPPVSNEICRRQWERHHEFMKWLDSELQTHGVEPKVFVKGFSGAISDDKLRNGGGVPICDVPEPTLGRYFWRSARFME